MSDVNLSFILSEKTKEQISKEVLSWVETKLRRSPEKELTFEISYGFVMINDTIITMTRSQEALIKFIEKIISDFYTIPIEKIYQKTRVREVVEARQRIMYLLNRFSKMSLSSIGAHCGGKDHATVLHAKKTINNLMDTKTEFRKEMAEFSNMVNKFTHNIEEKAAEDEKKENDRK